MPRKPDPEYLSRNLEPSRFAQIDRRYKRDGDAARSLLNYLNISDILRLAVKAGTIQMNEDAIKAIIDIRDAVAHASENIVIDRESVTPLETEPGRGSDRWLLRNSSEACLGKRRIAAAGRSP